MTDFDSVDTISKNQLLLRWSGIGKFIALDFARRGAKVILACRSEARGTIALQEIKKGSGNQNVHLRLVDTSSLESVRKFAAQILEEEKELHILVNNAGASGGNSVCFIIYHIPLLKINLPKLVELVC